MRTLTTQAPLSTEVSQSNVSFQLLMGIHDVFVNLHEIQDKVAGDYDGGSGAHDAQPL
ncbi:hypothetical protein DPMN_186891 [Dreissena polymorpha]|uniref:Uncharacterized protein n=1 Tax=Dreissena polymorpha TaxID=45954 RepID=A0A9D4I8K2_DREPO|nr:hypothetical protein DPMN_186891 [Dreissena polymorpha]